MKRIGGHEHRQAWAWERPFQGPKADSRAPCTSVFATPHTRGYGRNPGIALTAQPVEGNVERRQADVSPGPPCSQPARATALQHIHDFTLLQTTETATLQACEFSTLKVNMSAEAQLAECRSYEVVDVLGKKEGQGYGRGRM